MPGINSRQSLPPGPPAQFDPNRIPSTPGAQNVLKAQQQLEQEHVRLKPEERFRSPERPGSPVQSTIPPLPMPGLPGGLPAHIQKTSSYPAYRYHAIKAPIGMVVNDPDDEQRRAPASEGWTKRPPSKQPEVSTANRLELLEEIIQALAGEAEPDEEPLQVLQRLIEERDDYARKFTSLSKGKEK